MSTSALLYKRTEQKTDQLVAWRDIPINVSSAGFPTYLGAGFTVRPSPPIALDPTRVYCAVLISSQIPNIVPNISAALGNNSFTYNNGTGPFALTIPDGLYDLPGLQYMINLLIYKRGEITDPEADPAFIFTAIQSTQQVAIMITMAGWTFEITPDGIGTIIGFPDGLYGPGPGLIYDSSQPAANFGQVFAFYIHCSLISGSYLGANGSTTIGDVLGVCSITEPPGALISQVYNFPVKVPMGVTQISEINFYLTDQNGNTITSLLDQVWSVQLYITEVKDSAE
jgi:hypothetical protein